MRPLWPLLIRMISSGGVATPLARWWSARGSAKALPLARVKAKATCLRQAGE